MSQNIIEFPCPSCQSALRVPAEMAGVQGPCPACFNTIAAPHPQRSQITALAPAPAPQASTQPSPPPQSGQQAPPAQSPAPLEQQQMTAPAGFGQPPAAVASGIPAARPSGTAPPQQSSNSSSNPVPGPGNPGKFQTPERRVEAASPAPMKGRMWPAIVFPLLFIVLSLMAIYFILDLMGILNPATEEPQKDAPMTPNSGLITPRSSTEIPSTTDSGAPPAPSSRLSDLENESNPLLGTQKPKGPSTPDAPTPVTPPSADLPAPDPNKPLKHDPRDIGTPNDIPSDLPEVTKKRPEEIERARKLEKRRQFIAKSDEVLDRFLKAKTLEERRPYLTKSERTEEQLLASCLNKPMPRKLLAEPKLVSENDEILTLETYFTIALAAEEGVKAATPRSLFVRLISFSEDELPRIHTDPFIDIYDNAPATFSDNPSSEPLTLRTIVAVSTLCFEDGIPNNHNKGTISFFPSFARHSSTYLKAYLNKDTELFKKLHRKLGVGIQRPITLTLRWNKIEDPANPYIEVARMNGFGWTL